MKAKQIIFTSRNKAELLEVDCRGPEPDEVVVKMAFTTISQGTERANISGDLNIHAFKPKPIGSPVFPRYAGYSNSGIVYSIGKNVSEFKINDRVAGWWGSHKSYCEFDKENLIKLDDEIDLDVASIAHIACFPMGAIRKTRLEIGESAIVFGLGILGMLAIQELRAAGATPIIAVDPIESRRELALENGADVALDSNDPIFVEKVKALTGDGANIAIEVTGSGRGLNQALDVIMPKGRIALLGCTRNNNFTVDYYRKVHGPGITLIGAHTASRPHFDSYPGFWTVHDEMAGILRLQKGSRINLGKVIAEVHSPVEASKVYERMLNEKDFPIGIQFNWSLIE